MKKIFNWLLLPALFLITWSCKKDENKIYFEGGTAPVLSATVTTPVLPLAFLTRADQAVKFSWTNPDYKFTTGVSSQDVTYILDVDTTGSNFTNPKKASVSVSKDLTKTFTQAEFNDLLLNQLLLMPDMAHNIEVRITSKLVNSAAPLYSNVIKYTTTPYKIPPKVTPSANLYITGGATPGNWMGGGDPELLSQKFTKLTETTFELSSVTLSGGGEYLLVPVYGNWDNKFGAVVGTNDFPTGGGDFSAGGNNFKAPASSGNYKIEVNFQTGKTSVTKL